MGILNLFSRRPESDTPLRLPQGSFTVDPRGRIVASTLPASFPKERQEQIIKLVLTSFHEAREAAMPVSELIIDFSALRLTAREMRGGALIFLSPRSLR